MAQFDSRRTILDMRVEFLICASTVEVAIPSKADDSSQSASAETQTSRSRATVNSVSAFEGGKWAFDMTRECSLRHRYTPSNSAALSTLVITLALALMQWSDRASVRQHCARIRQETKERRQPKLVAVS